MPATKSSASACIRASRWISSCSSYEAKTRSTHVRAFLTPTSGLGDDVTLSLQIPGQQQIALEYLLLDMNGTLTQRGEMLDGVAERLAVLRATLDPQLLTADTFGTVAIVSKQLALPATTVGTGTEKLAVLRRLGPSRCVAIGNGHNDALMLAEAAVGIAIIGPEGCSGRALAASDIVCRSITEALDLVNDPAALAATLRP